MTKRPDRKHPKVERQRAWSKRVESSHFFNVKTTSSLRIKLQAEERNGLFALRGWWLSLVPRMLCLSSACTGNRSCSKRGSGKLKKCLQEKASGKDNNEVRLSRWDRRHVTANSQEAIEEMEAKNGKKHNWKWYDLEKEGEINKEELFTTVREQLSSTRITTICTRARRYGTWIQAKYIGL